MFEDNAMLTQRIILLSLFSIATIHAEEVATLDEVIVTANKFAENRKNVAGSISVIDSNAIDEKNITNVSDVIKQVPNMTEQDYSYIKYINFRGVNTSKFSQTNPVVIYVDGIPQSSAFGYDALIENAERVEVLRGPQGSVYGKDAIGGVINIVSKEPENAWSGQVGLEYGSNNHLQGTLNADGAVIDDTVFLTIGALAEKDDGWITNDYDNSDADTTNKYQINSTLTLKPTEDLTAKLTLGASKRKLGFFKGSVTDFDQATREDAEHANLETPYESDEKTTSQALSIDYQLGDINLSSVTTHKQINSSGVYDLDQTYDANNASYYDGLHQFQDIEIGELTQEFKLTGGDEDSRLKWVAGVYLDKGNIEYKQIGYQFPYVDPTSGTFYGNYEQNVPSQTDSKTAAIFAQASYGVTDKLTLTLGGRYQHISKEVSLNSYTYPLGSNQNSAIATMAFDESASWNAFLPKVGASYVIADDVNIYATYSKGYLPGGFNTFPRNQLNDIRFDEQTSDNFELGLRGDFLDGDLNLGVSVFYMDIDDIHLYNYDSTTKTFIVSNGGKGESKGIELDALYAINDNWRVNMALGVNRAKYTEHTDATYNGNRIENTPTYTANLGISYMHPTGFYGAVAVNAQGKTFFDDANQKSQKAWANLDVKLGYMSDDLEIYGYINNVTDESHIEANRDTQTYFNTPRTFGLGLKYDF